MRVLSERDLGRMRVFGENGRRLIPGSRKKKKDDTHHGVGTEKDNGQQNDRTIEPILNAIALSVSKTSEQVMEIASVNNKLVSSINDKLHEKAHHAATEPKSENNDSDNNRAIEPILNAIAVSVEKTSKQVVGIAEANNKLVSSINDKLREKAQPAIIEKKAKKWKFSFRREYGQITEMYADEIV